MNHNTYEGKITKKQKWFFEYYMKTANATQSAIMAGYSEKTAYSQGSRLLKNKKVNGYLDYLMEEEHKKRKEFNNYEVSGTAMMRLMDRFNGDEVRINEFVDSLVKEALSPRVATAEEINERNKTRSVYFPKATRYEVMYQAGFKCQACGRKPAKENEVVLEIDHIVPRNLGGTNDYNNLQVLCKNCNSSKKDDYMFNHNEDWLKNKHLN